MTTQRAEVICDSYGEHSPRLTTFKLRYPKSIHGEFMTHRTHSRNAGSSRAIPVSVYVRDSIDNMYVPQFYENQKGMQVGEPFAPEKQAEAEAIWRDMADYNGEGVKKLAALNAHKGDINRPLEWFGWITVLATAVEDGWLNFFGLRLHEAAHPEIQKLARLMWAAWNESTPQPLLPGDWHLPFCDVANEYVSYQTDSLTYLDIAIRVSVARCARVSYESFETGKRSTVDEDLALYERLVGSTPLHASPAEHQATPDNFVVDGGGSVLWCDCFGSEQWQYPGQHGNLHGWRQYRKTLPGERIAPLPADYKYKWRRP